MKKIAVIMLAVSLLLTGCWDLTETEKLGLVVLMGIDTSDEGQVKVCIYEMSNRSRADSAQTGSSIGKVSFKLREAAASTINEAIEKIAASDYHRPYFAHTGAIIISEELAGSKGIADFIDFFERNPEIRRNTWLLIARKGQFCNIFSTVDRTGPGTDPGEAVKEIISNRSINSFLTTNKLGEFLDLYWETGSEPYTSGIGAAEPDRSNFDIEGTAVFKKEKLVGWLDNDEGKGLLWVNGGMEGGIISVKYEGKKIALRIIKAASKLEPLIINGEMQINIRISLSSNISESQANLGIQNKEIIEQVQVLQAKEVKRQILAAFDKSKRLGSDIFEFGNYFYGKYPAYWKQEGDKWYEHYQDVKVNIDVSSTIYSMGLVKGAKNQ